MLAARLMSEDKVSNENLLKGLEIIFVDEFSPIEGEWCLYENTLSENLNYNKLTVYLKSVTENNKTRNAPSLFYYMLPSQGQH